MRYDVIVIGSGHAGCEAALAAARLGASVGCITVRIDRTAHMPCNCSIGGPAKGHLAREIDALGGQMAVNIDCTLTHIRAVGTGKGPAVRTLRAHADKSLYPERMLGALLSQPGLTMIEGAVDSIITRQGACLGVKMESGEEIESRAVVITTGTFLNGVCHTGEVKESAARHGERAVVGLGQSLRSIGLRMGRFKTGTTPRIDRASVDFGAMETLHSDTTEAFSFLHDRIQVERKLLPCWRTRTNERTASIIQANLHRSAMYSGQIEGVGPRYCPSIEDKIARFPDKESHPVFLEQEYWDKEDLYVQGTSTSLPAEVQLAFLRTLPGLQDVEMNRPGYAVEYDVIFPDQLSPMLMVKAWPGLFSAGQINGTSGYEEAAAQGLVAGINAAHFALGREPIVLERSQSYIGVMIDDLVTKGAEDPYRMLTGRAEYRLALRHDNADERLTPIARKIGLASVDRAKRFECKTTEVQNEIERLKGLTLGGRHNPLLESAGLPTLTGSVSAYDYLSRPGVVWDALAALFPSASPVSADARFQVETQAKYAYYLRKQDSEVQRMRRLEEHRIPEGIDFLALRAISKESREKLAKVRPLTVGQASRVPGVRPADISALLVYLKK
ncbi:MAG: tRNA uridine-5-carboxymethylaminomethyl(34) synthesis enzyme MnmG [Armatimonadetes bacterium]|nr:tRNA uridine-5-carboxymethylaminomethyl(34) synthesis enzyme MnmG [Armatimonadota bacterium]